MNNVLISWLWLQIAGLAHHDEDDSDSLSSGAVSNSDSGRGPSSDEGPGGAAGSQATLERNKQGEYTQPHAGTYNQYCRKKL